MKDFKTLLKKDRESHIVTENHHILTENYHILTIDDFYSLSSIITKDTKYLLK